MSVRITHDSEDSTRIVAAIEGEIDHHSAKALREAAQAVSHDLGFRGDPKYGKKATP